VHTQIRNSSESDGKTYISRETESEREREIETKRVSDRERDRERVEDRHEVDISIPRMHIK